MSTTTLVNDATMNITTSENDHSQQKDLPAKYCFVFCEIIYLTILTLIVEVVYYLLQRDPPQLPSMEQLPTTDNNSTSSQKPTYNLPKSFQIRKGNPVNNWMPFELSTVHVDDDVPDPLKEVFEIFQKLNSPPLPPSGAVNLAPVDYCLFWDLGWVWLGN